MKSTEGNYPVKESTMRLSGEQRAAAAALLAERPPVHPGTRAIVSRELALAWYDRVNARIDELGLKASQVGAFCDVAGVPD